VLVLVLLLVLLLIRGAEGDSKVQICRRL